MKQLLALSVFVVSSFSFSAFALNAFPAGPDESVTPGVLCSQPDTHRYPEQINYCNRDVNPDTKRALFVEYDQMGYRTQSLPRGDFKIDHFIPLCMGGANDPHNLWPQHKSIYVITDPLEELLCSKMAIGKLLQADAVKLMKQAKHNLDQVPAITQQVNAL